MLHDNSSIAELATSVPLGVFGELVGAIETSRAAPPPNNFPPEGPTVTYSSLTVPAPTISSSDATNPTTAGRARTGLASRLRSATVVGGGSPMAGKAPDALMTAVHSIRVMNTKTTGETALSKAAFYDHMLKAIDVGKDEQMAFAEGVKAVKELDEQRKRRMAALASPMIADPSSVKQADLQPQQLPLPSQGGATSPTPAVAAAPSPSPVSLAGPTLALASQTGVPRSPSTDSMADKETAGTTGRTKLKGIFTNIIKPTISLNADDSFIDSNSAGGQGASMAHLRVLHRKLCMTVEDYDKMTTEMAAERESSILESARRAIQKVADDTRKAVTAEYEPRIQHDKCNARISVLERENRIMMDETTRTIDLNKQLTAQIAALKLNSSTAVSENALLIEELAKRRLQGDAIREKLRVAQRRLAELEGGVFDEAVGDGADEDQEDEDAVWEEWCQTKTFSRPSWDMSTASKLLSQKAPPSVIHIGENGLDADDMRRSNRNSRAGSAKARKPQSATTDDVAHDTAYSDTRNITEPEDAASTIRGLLTVLKRSTNIQPRSSSRALSAFESMDDTSSEDDEDGSEKENDVASLRAHSPSKKQPHHRPSSAPITGAGAGIPSDEVRMQPGSFARPAVQTGAAKSSAAWAARVAGISIDNGEDVGPDVINFASHQQQLLLPKPSASSSYAAAPPPTPALAPPRPSPTLPPPSHNSRATAFSIAKWVERTTTSRPRSAPASRFAAPEALQSLEAVPLKKTPAPLLSFKHTRKHPISGPSRLSHPTVTGPPPASSLEIITPRQGTRATRPASAPSTSFRAGGHGGLLVGRAHPRFDTLHEGRLVGIAVSGRQI
ncbi:hypothetical protein HDU88_002063 [Geranomyces variabilis]|nr:hypothetical protein HDU88_002063 [Geranomyces variabilis]